MERQTAADFDQELLDIYDEYVHGQTDRRGFINRAAKFAVGGMTAAALLDNLKPNYALADQVGKEDERIKAGYISYPSPEGHEKTKGYLVQPSKAEGTVPGVLVIHENRGLNPYVEDVARRVATAGFLALAPDALAPKGGYPGTDDEGRLMQREIDRGKMTQDFIAAARYLHKHDKCSGKVGVVGFCFGGGISNTLAVLIPDIITAAVPYYGRVPAVEDVPKIKASLLLQYAELDRRINRGWPDYEAALKESSVDYTAHMYEGVNHGFHNDTTPRYDEAVAELSWKRTIDFFNEKLREKKEE